MMKEEGVLLSTHCPLLFLQLAEPPRRFGNIIWVEVLALAPAIDDLLQPEPRPDGVLRQAAHACVEHLAKVIRAEVRAEVRSLSRIHEPEYIVLRTTDAT